MTNSKIDSLKVGTSTYDITLPIDATPSITSLTTSTLTVKGTSNLTDVNCPILQATEISASIIYGNVVIKAPTIAATGTPTDPSDCINVQYWNDNIGSASVSYANKANTDSTGVVLSTQRVNIWSSITYLETSILDLAVSITAIAGRIKYYYGSIGGSILSANYSSTMPYEIINGLYMSSSIIDFTMSLDGTISQIYGTGYYPLRIMYNGRWSTSGVPNLTNTGSYSIYYIDSYGSQISMARTSTSTIMLRYIEL